MTKRASIFCGSRAGVRDSYRSAARRTADLLVEHGFGVVFGGGRLGLMGVVADAVLARGGEIVAVIPGYLRRAEVEHTGVTVRHVVNDLFERKGLMMDLGDVFIALPGGMGTLDELLEVLTWRQLGRHGKPVALLNTDGYFDPFVGLLKHAVTEGFLSAEQLELLIVEREPAILIDALCARVEPTSASSA
jgi:hypothetical protein